MAYTLVRNEGGSIGIAFVNAIPQRRMQAFQQVLNRHIAASNGVVQQFVGTVPAKLHRFPLHNRSPDE